MNEMMKLEAMIPKAKALLPPGGAFELPIGNADFIGFMDYLWPAGWMNTRHPSNYWGHTEPAIKMVQRLSKHPATCPGIAEWFPFSSA